MIFLCMDKLGNLSYEILHREMKYVEEHKMWHEMYLNINV